jgi:hypothetical protein
MVKSVTLIVVARQVQVLIPDLSPYDKFWMFFIAFNNIHRTYEAAKRSKSLVLKEKSFVSSGAVCCKKILAILWFHAA